ncbi:aldo/keto reductase [soil metagenome]
MSEMNPIGPEERRASRRQFIKTAALAGIATTFSGSLLLGGQTMETAATNAPGQIPRRPLGKTGLQVSAMGLGGWHLGSTRSQEETNDIVARSIDAGVNFFDNAWEYHNGDSEVRMGVALKGRRGGMIVMTKVCTHGRGKETAMQMLEDSLRRLQTDHIDIWQIHEVIYKNDPELIFAPGGVAEALLLAKQQGKVRFVGFTGHKDPSIHLRVLDYKFPFDTIQMPLNCFDANYRSFEGKVLPVANRLGLGVLGMKSLGGTAEMVTSRAITAEEGLGYAMSLPVATTISGIESLKVLEQNLKVARDFQPFPEVKMQILRDRCCKLAQDGHFEKFKSTTLFDGALGQSQQGKI